MEKYKDKFVTPEIAKKLKDIGYNEPCLGYYAENTNPPHFQNMSIDYMEERTNSFIIDIESKHPKSHKAYSAPFWQDAIDWLLDIISESDDDLFCTSFSRYSDNSGEWRWNDVEPVVFDNLIQAVEIGIDMVEKINKKK